MSINIGIDKNHRQQLIEALSKVLANTYTLYLKTQNFHWNVTGPRFHDLHLMLEEQYTELAEVVDDIAERIRALDAPSPASFKQFLELATIKEETGVPSANDMLKQLTADHELLSRQLQELAHVAAEADDEVTEGMAAERMQAHQKTAWMLRSSI